MSFSKTHTTNVETTVVSLSELKGLVLQRWFYADVNFIVDNSNFPLRVHETMKKVSIALRAIAIMNSDDVDAQKLWFSVDPFLNIFVECGWEIRVGEHAGYLCIRILDVENISAATNVDIEIPREGTRQLRNVDAWCAGMRAIQ